MANGFKALRHVGGGAQRYIEYPLTPASTAAIYNGDAVQIDATLGTIEIAGLDVATGVGVFIGCRYVNGSGSQIFSNSWPADTAATEAYAIVSADQEVTYKVVAAAATQAAVGDLFETVDNGSETLGLSTQTVIAGADNGPWVMVSLLPTASNGDVMIEVRALTAMLGGSV